MANRANASVRASAAKVPAPNAQKAKGKTQGNVTNIYAKFTEGFSRSFLESDGKVREAEKAFMGSQASQVESLVESLKGCGKVTEEAFATHWKRPVDAALVASGRYAEASIPVVMSLLRVAVVGITHKVMPVKGESLKVYAHRARDVLKDKGVLAASKGGRPEGAKGQKPPTRVGSVTPPPPAPTAQGAAPTAPTPPGERKFFGGAAEHRKAALMLAQGDNLTAQMLEIVSEKYLVQFRDWARQLIAEETLSAKSAKTPDAPKA